MAFHRISEDREVVWTGEHWIVYLKNHQNQADVARVSLYKVAYSRQGDGHVAFIDAPEWKLSGIYSDDQRVAKFISRTVSRGASNNNLLKRDMEYFPATFAFQFQRDGKEKTPPTWRIETDSHELEVAWENVHDPLALHGDGPVTRGATVTHSLLFFANSATIRITNKGEKKPKAEQVPGVVYVREDWLQTIGRQGTSAVFALSETTMTVASD